LSGREAAECPALEATLRACDEAATWAGAIAFEKDVKRCPAEPGYCQVAAGSPGRVMWDERTMGSRTRVYVS
jgi:hypothetical protein